MSLLRRNGSSIPVILLQKVDNYGEPGDIVKVLICKVT